MDGEVVELAKSFFSVEQWNKMRSVQQNKYAKLYYIYNQCLALDIVVVPPRFMIALESTETHRKVPKIKIRLKKFDDDEDFEVINEVDEFLEEDEEEYIDIVDRQNNNEKWEVRNDAYEEEEGINEDSLYPCPFCQTMYAIKSERDMHKKTCRKRFNFLKQATKFKCEHCNYSTVYQQCLEVHKRVHTKERPFKCSHCSFTFTQKTDLANHIRSIHSNEPKKHKCQKCGYETHRINSYNRHLKTHSDILNYVCQFCKKGFKYKDSYDQHLYQHNGLKKPFSCQFCDKGFIKNAHLVVHVKTIHDKNPSNKDLVCQTCGYRTAEKGTYKRHIAIHAGYKPYGCGQCDYKSVTNSDLKRHVNNRHGEIKKHLESINKMDAVS